MPGVTYCSLGTGRDGEIEITSGTKGKTGNKRGKGVDNGDKKISGPRIPFEVEQEASKRLKKHYRSESEEE